MSLREVVTKVGNVRVGFSREQFLEVTGGNEDLAPGFTSCFTDGVNRAVIDYVMQTITRDGPPPEKFLFLEGERIPLKEKETLRSASASVKKVYVGNIYVEAAFLGMEKVEVREEL